jgi:hypothetical protein
MVENLWGTYFVDLFETISPMDIWTHKKIVTSGGIDLDGYPQL